MADKIRLAILGATGMAGRDALRHHALLDEMGLQYAELTCVTASPKSKGRKLGDVFDEKETRLVRAYPEMWEGTRCPASLGDLVIDATDPEVIASKADYAISALGSDIAREVEPELARLGVHTFSNSSAYRWDPEVPLLIPEVNFYDMRMVESQKTPGKRVCNPNCTTAGYVPVLNLFLRGDPEIKSVTLVTQQALSGKGDAVADPEYVRRIRGNVIDDWTNGNQNEEEWKSSCEPQKILGLAKTKDEVKKGWNNYFSDYFPEGAPRTLPIFSQTTRVVVQNGHLEHVMLEFDKGIPKDKFLHILTEYKMPDAVAGLPTSPKQLFHFSEGMPMQTRDLGLENGMAVVIGDIKFESMSRVSMWTLTHNLRRGATWAGRQGMELYLRKYKGMFK